MICSIRIKFYKQMQQENTSPAALFYFIKYYRIRIGINTEDAPASVSSVFTITSIT